MGHVADGPLRDGRQRSTATRMAMAATRAMLTRVATAEAYARMDPPGGTNGGGCRAVDRRPRARGPCRCPSAPRAASSSRTPRSATTGGSTRSTTRYNHAHWLIQHNGGVFLPPWGKMEQWLISTQHDDADGRPLPRQLRGVGDGARGLRRRHRTGALAGTPVRCLDERPFSTQPVHIDPDHIHPGGHGMDVPSA